MIPNQLVGKKRRFIDVNLDETMSADKLENDQDLKEEVLRDMIIEEMPKMNHDTSVDKAKDMHMLLY